MHYQYIMCTRKISNPNDQCFSNEPGPTTYLKVPISPTITSNPTPSPAHIIPVNEWFEEVRTAATWRNPDENNPEPRGDIVFFVHGYNNSPEVIQQRHTQLEKDLGAEGFKGVVVSFDWPCAASAINYLEDRHDAKKTAMQLVSDGIRHFSSRQKPDCCINLHIIGHSTGAYVIREAFDDADDSKLDNGAWIVSQIIFIGADVSSGSMSASNSTTESLYRHCTRLTNYSNKHDNVLKLSNMKRAGAAPRVGRVGLPNTIPSKAVNIDCTEYFGLLSSDPAKLQQHQNVQIGTFNHSWHIGNKIFAKDLFQTLIGDSDRSQIPTRTSVNGELILIG